MRNVILQEFVTLDGLAAGPNDSVDFVPASTRGDQAFGREQLALMDSIDAILLGRVTYQMFAGYWPQVTEGDDKLFADKINATPKIVFSNSLEQAPWGKWEVRGSSGAERPTKSAN
jgi:dihydrofolate reductase